MWLVFLLQIVLGSGIICPEGRHKCPDAATCCQLPDHSYGCCPTKNAVCCDDHIHCCPEGMKCDAGLCVNINLNLSIASTNNFRNVCPGGQYTCPDGSTCCFNSKGEMSGCCLLPDAICCTDGQHCCPKGSTCDDIHQLCHSNRSKLIDTPKNSGAVLSIFRSEEIKTNSTMKNTELDIVCPGGRYHCPDNETCCQMDAGVYGCCPFPKATCCLDKLHCCPYEMKCDVSSSSCQQRHHDFTWSAIENVTAN